METLVLNFPTVAYWDGTLDYLKEEVIEDYQVLIDSKIIFSDPIEAAEHINQIWEDIDSWWQSEKVQSARKHFCNKYAKVVKKPHRKLGEILLKLSEGEI